MVCPGLARIERWWERLRVRDRSGAVLILFALSAPLLITLVGLTIDYSFASYVNLLLTRAADASALAAVSQTAATAVGGYSNTAALQSYGSRVFNANIKNAPATNVGFNLAVTQASANGLVTASGTYTYAVPTFFGKLLGVSSITVANSIKATALPTTYINYYLLIDVSNSMGIGATQQDMTDLYNATKTYNTQFQQESYPETGCVFACHTASSSWNTGISTEQVARNKNVNLRIDSAKAAIQSIINSAAATAANTRNISFGIYLLQNGSKNKSYTMLNAQSTDYSALLTSSNGIDLVPTVGYGETDTKNFLADIAAMLPSNGSGASATSPLNYVFLVTDGVADVYGGGCSPATTCFSPVTPSWCDAVKAKSTLGVIYTTYLDIWKNNNPATNTAETLFGNYVASFKTQIQPSLSSCATDTSYFFKADDGPAIVSQMQALFIKTQPASARLTQ